MSDFSELFDLAADLSGVPEEALRNVDKALKFTSVEIKKDWQQGAERSGLTAYAASVDFTMHYGPNEISSEIGPNLGRPQGAFGFVEDGGGDVHSAPQHAGRDALEANEADFERGLEIAATQAVVDKVEGG